MPEPTVGSLRKLYRYSCSEDIYDLIVEPLALAIAEKDEPNYKETEGILDSLKELHKCLWQITKGKPPKPDEFKALEFPGAVAGRFEELMLPLRKAVKNGWETIKVGAEAQKITKEARRAGAKDWSLGGDATVYKTGGPTITYQLKVANAGSEGAIVEHLNKAGAQLTGLTGEIPEDGSTKVIYLLVQNTATFDAYTAGQWKGLVDRALAKQYESNHAGSKRTVTPDEIKAAVDLVKIFTPTKRFKFTVIGGVVQDPTEKGASSSRYLAYANGPLEAHWKWLIKWYADRAEENKATDWGKTVQVTKDNGVNGKVGSWTVLPRQSPTGIAL